MKLVISLATRGRPQQLADTISKSLANWTDPNTVMAVALDEDDTATIGYLNNAAPHAWFVGSNGPRVVLDVKKREDTIAAKWNRALAIPGDLYLVAADDDPYITPGYDSKLLEGAKLFPDGIGMVYGHMANMSFSGAVAPTRGLVEKMGHIFPELFPYWFVDHWTDDLARLIGRLAFADVRTDQSKAGMTQEMRDPAWWATFYDANYLVRRKIAREIIDSPDLQTADWQKAILREHYPLIEERSRAINQNVRAQFGGNRAPYGANVKDERYERLRSAAEAMIPDLLSEMEPTEAKMFRDMLLPAKTIAAIPQAYPPKAA